MLRLALAAMLLAANSAWAASGWYLLVPPLSHYDEHAQYLNGFKVLHGKPLSEWGQAGAFDSASACEATKGALTSVEQRTYSLSSNDYLKAIEERTLPANLSLMRFNAEADNAKVWAYMASRCIRSDDPRLEAGAKRAQ